jgi:hypothetical protein
MAIFHIFIRPYADPKDSYGKALLRTIRLPVNRQAKRNKHRERCYISPIDWVSISYRKRNISEFQLSLTGLCRFFNLSYYPSMN